jgi:hypothetical protein
MTDKEIIQLAIERGIEFDEFCLLNFVKEKIGGRYTIDDILDEYEDLIGY